MTFKDTLIFKDNNVTKEARSARYAEYCGLNHLPFMSKEQSRRLTRLKTLRVRDNRIAFGEDLANGGTTYGANK